MANTARDGYQRAVPIKETLGRNMYRHQNPRIPQYSRSHPLIPKLYTPAWRTDMVNRDIITRAAEQGGRFQPLGLGLGRLRRNVLGQ